MSQRRYEITDFEWSILAPLLPNKLRGVPRVDDRRVLNGIFWPLRTGSPWADVPARHGPPTTCYNRFFRWRKFGAWDRIFDAVSPAYDGDLQMVDSSSIRVHQRAANVKRASAVGRRWDLAPARCMPHRVNVPAFSGWLYRSRNPIERFFSKLRCPRAVATRFEKHDANYLALVKLAAARIWMPFVSR